MHLPKSMMIAEFNFGIDGTATEAIKSVVSSDAIREVVLQEYICNSALDLAFKSKNEMPPAKSTSATKYGNYFVEAKIKTDHTIANWNVCHWLIVGYQSCNDTTLGNAQHSVSIYTRAQSDTDITNEKMMSAISSVPGSYQFHAIVANAYHHKHFAWQSVSFP